MDLVVTDLDGTLWHTDDHVHPRTLGALEELRLRGQPLLVATGRRVTSTRDPLERIGWRPSAVMLNGAIGLDLATDAMFHWHPFTAASARSTLAAFRDAGIDPAVYVQDPDVEVFISTTPGTSVEHLAALGRAVRVADLEGVVSEFPILSFGLIGAEYEPCLQVVKQLDGIATAALDRSIDYGGAALIVSPLGLSKWDGVLAYCARGGIDPNRILAIGDGPNDVELLSHAAVSVSLEGSHPAALAAADHVVPAPREGGWADILDLL